MNVEGENKNLRSLSREEVAYSELKDGRKGVSLAEGNYFLHVWRKGEWRFKLYDGDCQTALTGTFTLKSIEGLKTSPKATGFRSYIRHNWSNPHEIVEWIIAEIEKHLDEWPEPQPSDIVGASKQKANAPSTMNLLSPEEALERMLESEGQSTIHPLIDFHVCLGLTLGFPIRDANETLIFAKEKPIITRNGILQLNGIFPQDFSVSCQGTPELHPTTLEEMLRLVAEARSKGKIEFPSEKEVFENTLRGIETYWYHTHPAVYVLIACWIIGTYMHPMFKHYPALILQGRRETGKSTLLQILAKTCWNPTPLATALRGAPLFRAIEARRKTYIVDITRLDTRSQDYGDIIDILETGTEKNGAVPRSDKETLEPHYYRTYGPKAIASRYELPFTVKAIRIITEQAPSNEYSMRQHRLDSDERWPRIVNLLLRAAMKYWPEVLNAYNSLEPTPKLVRRSFDYWAPILAVCKVFAPEHYESLVKLAEEMVAQTERADRLSHVEDASIAYLAQLEGPTVTMTLKEITEQVDGLLPEPVGWQTVRAALQNTGLIKRTYKKAKGTSYLLDVEKAKKLAEERGIQLGPEEEQPTQQTSLEEEPPREECRAVLTQENFQLVFGAIKRGCKHKSYVTTEEIEYLTGLKREVLQPILNSLEREGKIVQVFSGCWKPA